MPNVDMKVKAMIEILHFFLNSPEEKTSSDEARACLRKELREKFNSEYSKSILHSCCT